MIQEGIPNEPMQQEKRALEWMWMRLQPDRVESSPVFAYVEPGAVCNLRCPFCATGAREAVLAGRFLAEGIFQKILERLGDRLREVHLYRWGEPLLSPHLPALVAKASARGLLTHVSTHFSLPSFGPEAARRLVESGLSTLIVSLDGATQESYRRYRVGGDIRDVLRNIKLLVRAKLELGSSSPLILWKYLIHRGNQHELSKARAMAAELGIAFSSKGLRIPASERRRWRAHARVLRQANPLPAEVRGFGASLRTSGGEPVSFFKTAGGEPAVTACFQAWLAPSIDSDGTVFPCCVVSDRRYGLGNILAQPLSKIWNSASIVALRRYLKTGEREGVELPCYRCAFNPHAS